MFRRTPGLALRKKVGAIGDEKCSHLAGTSSRASYFVIMADFSVHLLPGYFREFSAFLRTFSYTLQDVDDASFPYHLGTHRSDFRGNFVLILPY